MRGKLIVGVMVMSALAGCQPMDCVETLAPHEKILHGVPGMLVAYAVAWAGLDAARWALDAPETKAGRISGICALAAGAAGLGGLVAGPVILVAVLMCSVLPMVWVIPLARAGRSRTPLRVAGALAFTAAAGVVLAILGVANGMLVHDAGRNCAPTGPRYAPIQTPIRTPIQTPIQTPSDQPHQD